MCIRTITTLVMVAIAPYAFPAWPPTDGERENLRGSVHAVTYPGPPPRSSRLQAESKVGITFDRDGWLREQVYPDTDGSPSSRTAFQRNPDTGVIVAASVNPWTGATTTTTTRIIRDTARRTLTFETIDPPPAPAVPYVAAIERYDRRGNLIENTGYYWNPPASVRHRSRFVYDKQGRKTKAIEWDPHGADEATVIFKYDQTGHVAQESWYNKDGSLRGTTRYTYKLDAHGNWVERTSQLCSPARQGSTQMTCFDPITAKRQISYYDEEPATP